MSLPEALQGDRWTEAIALRNSGIDAIEKRFIDGLTMGHTPTLSMSRKYRICDNQMPIRRMFVSVVLLLDGKKSEMKKAPIAESL